MTFSLFSQSQIHYDWGIGKILLVVPSANPRNAAGKNRFKQISAWINACQSARNELGIKGMCCVGGKTVQGKALYVKAKAIFGK